MVQRMSKAYTDVIFERAFLENIIDHFIKLSEGTSFKDVLNSLKLTINDTQWRYETLVEFFFEYGEGKQLFEIHLKKGEYSMSLINRYMIGQPSLTIEAPTKPKILTLLTQFDQNAKPLTLNVVNQIKPNIFIGHGRDNQWKELKNHLVDLHHFTVNAYESEVRAGNTILEILKEMLDVSNFAILVLTAENEYKDGSLHARENVIHELGLFQSKLNFTNVIILKEGELELLSNIQGVQYITFASNNIKSSFGEVVAAINKAFGHFKE